jgi:hypothetical protein
LDALTDPGADGINLAVFTTDSLTAISWTNATEITEAAVNVVVQGAAWELGVPAGNIVATSGNDQYSICGVSLR